MTYLSNVDLNYSRPLDVHRWSDHPEVNNFVDKIREQYEKQLKDLQEAYGEAMLELRARKKFQALLDAADDK